MKKQSFAYVALALICLIAVSAHAKQKSWKPILGARYYAEHSAFDDLPFSSGDLGYIAGAQFHDQNGLLMALVSYTPELDGEKWVKLGKTDVADYVITPELTMLARDKGWLAGAGMLASYITTDTDEGWTDIYYKFQLGYLIGENRVTLSANADYVFESIDELSEFDFDDIDFTLLLHIAL